jgi:hypothetical protein
LLEGHCPLRISVPCRRDPSQTASLINLARPAVMHL